jgi:hypothetical protein
MWEWDVDWRDVRTGLMTTGVLSGSGYLIWLMKARRQKIQFFVTKVHFGATENWNLFMGRNYPSQDLISLECDIKFFSNKMEPTGLHDFRLEFCRSTYMGKIVEYTVSKDHIYRGLMKAERNSSIALDTVALPSKEFVSFELSTMIQRKDWAALKQCDFARLSCKTPEGKMIRFSLAHIRFPAMPSEGLRGPHYMSTQFNVDKKTNRVFIYTQRRRTTLGPPGQLPASDDFRFWNGTTWVHSQEQAKMYRTVDEGRAEGEKIKIWDLVPSEWMENTDA